MSTSFTLRTAAPDPYSVRVEAWPSKVPGLAVVQGVQPQCFAGLWAVVHVRSGAAVWRCLPDRETGLLVARALRQLGDWTLPAADLRAAGVRDRLKTLRPHMHGPHSDGRDRNEVGS